MVRGFALFGILITNAAVLAGVLTSDGPVTPVRLWDHDATVDRFTDAGVTAIFLGRFYLLFAFLFGYSFTLQLASAHDAGRSAGWRTIRRCSALFVLGTLHAALLWVGDILSLYAVLGLILLSCARFRTRTALVSGVVLYLLFCTAALLTSGSGEWDEFLRLAELRSGYAGDPLDTLAAQLAAAPRFVSITWTGQAVPSLAMFLLGMAAGKAGLLQDECRIRRWTPRVVRIGLGIGLPVSAVTFADVAGLATVPHWWGGVQELANPAMTAAAVAVLIRCSETRPQVRAWLAPAGRMAATNYIGQSVVLMLFYSGYGSSPLARVPVLVVCLLGVLTFGAQLVVSRWWLQRYRYGPVEWVLRAITYLRMPRLTRAGEKSPTAR